MNRYTVELYTYVTVEQVVEATSQNEAIRIARERAEKVDFELIDEHEIVADWNVENLDWEFGQIAEEDDE